MTTAEIPTNPASRGDPAFLADLARGRAACDAIGPVLQHLVSHADDALFSDRVVARTRGMLVNLAERLLRSNEAPAPAQVADFADVLAATPGLLTRFHSLALEGQAAERLMTAGVDATLSPLVEARLGSGEAEAALAQAVLAAQSRFVRDQQRMQVTVAELSPPTFAGVLGALSDHLGASAEPAQARLKSEFDEDRTRSALLSRLGLALGDDFASALDLRQAGLALFATALSLATGASRDDVIMATAHGQQSRLLVLMAAAGIEPAAREAVLLLLHPGHAVPPAWFSLSSAEAERLIVGATE